jgi:8-oxo-dGTP diphosphatase
MPTTKRIEVAAGLVFRNGQLLITQRRPGDHLGGLWEFPGGKREGAESYEHCLARELHEELGIDVNVGALYDSISHDYPEKSVHLQFFLCTILVGEPKPIACAAIAWVTKDSLMRFDFPAADAQLLRKLREDEVIWRI